MQVRDHGVVPGACGAAVLIYCCGRARCFACAPVRSAVAQTSTEKDVLTSTSVKAMVALAMRRMWVARVADLVPDKNQTVRTAVTAVLQRVYADIDPECLVRFVATAPRQAQHHLLQALLSTLPDLPQQVYSPGRPLHVLHSRRKLYHVCCHSAQLHALDALKPMHEDNYEQQPSPETEAST